MSLKRLSRLRHTLAFRLTLWYAGIFTVSACVAFLLFYALITSVILERTDQELLDHAGQFSTVLAARGLNGAENLALIEAQAAGVRKVFFRLLYPTGLAFSSSNMEYWTDIGVGKQAIERLVGESRPVFETVEVPRRNDRVRVLYAIIGPGVILQVGQSMENYSRLVDAFNRIFVATMVLLIALAAGVGWFMARRAVSGVEAVTRTAHGISGGTLDERVPVNQRGDEIDQLALTFNQMLDRIQTLVTGIREMSDNIAHDLKSPITRIRGTAEVTLATSSSVSEYQGMAASTIEECDRLLDMINTLLIISKTEAGVYSMDRTTLDVAALAREACELFQPTAEDKGVTLDCETPNTCATAGDVRMIQRMLTNLVDNAIKYTPAGGRVTVSVRGVSDGAVVLSVSDTGPGIPEEDHARIFERFYRGDQSRSEPGTGLGLSLARAIARAHGGDITVESRPMEGSTFRVSLPAASPRVNAAD
jgi:heavy metal sensor kinase